MRVSWGPNENRGRVYLLGCVSMAVATQCHSAAGLHHANSNLNGNVSMLQVRVNNITLVELEIKADMTGG